MDVASVSVCWYAYIHFLLMSNLCDVSKVIKPLEKNSFIGAGANSPRSNSVNHNHFVNPDTGLDVRPIAQSF